jgi:hypothetical protein
MITMKLTTLRSFLFSLTLTSVLCAEEPTKKEPDQGRCHGAFLVGRLFLAMHNQGRFEQGINKYRKLHDVRASTLTLKLPYSTISDHLGVSPYTIIQCQVRLAQFPRQREK